MTHVFADRLIDAARRLGTPLCVGLDPFPDRIPALFGPVGEPDTAERFFMAVLDEVAGKVGVLKPQAGLFEPWGATGVAMMERLVARAVDLGLIVILDAKRGDIGTTAAGYAKACLGPGAAIAADCVTVNPYLGLDSLEPFAEAALATGKGVAVLVRTSNPGARDFQDLDVGGAPLWTRVAEALQGLEGRLTGGGDWSSLMVVMGATWPEEARRLRAILPRALVLVPGYGAQGGAAADALAAFKPGPRGPEGGVVSSSRGVLYPAGAAHAATMAAWRAAFHAEGLGPAIAGLRAASETVATGG
jgi:orotidine-5'-phosphate decarboxylase